MKNCIGLDELPDGEEVVENTCEWCGEPVFEDDETGDNGECPRCMEAAEYNKQREGDYRSMCF